jgi:hypothetical protein
MSNTPEPGKISSNKGKHRTPKMPDQVTLPTQPQQTESTYKMVFENIKASGRDTFQWHGEVRENPRTGPVDGEYKGCEATNGSTQLGINFSHKNSDQVVKCAVERKTDKGGNGDGAANPK